MLGMSTEGSNAPEALDRERVQRETPDGALLGSGEASPGAEFKTDGAGEDMNKVPACDVKQRVNSSGNQQTTRRSSWLNET